ncbi:MAG: hypothetical protein GC195_01640 [Nostoc sp. RI_552]|nr:hypothetical protein [Nostoc sp. RI_552]
MKRFNLFAATSVCSCCLGFMCADFVLAGPVPVGSLSGVTLPGRATAPVNITPVTVPQQTVFPANINAPTTTPVTVAPNVTPATPVTVAPNVTPTTPVTVAPNVTPTTPVTVAPNVTPTTPVTVAPNVTPTTPVTVAPNVTPTTPVTVAPNVTPATPVTVAPNVTPATPVTVAPNVTPATPVTVAPNVTPTTPVTPIQVGETAAAQVAIGRGVTVTGIYRTLSIPAATATVNDQVSTVVTLTSVNDNPSQFLLEGTFRQVTNTSAFLALATAAEFSLSQVQVGTSIALTGAEYTQVAALINTLPELFVSLAEPESRAKQFNFSRQLITSREDKKFQAVPISNVDPQILNRAILAYNGILDSSDDVTVIALSKNADFLAIGASLSEMRVAIKGL